MGMGGAAWGWVELDGTRLCTVGLDWAGWGCVELDGAM